MPPWTDINSGFIPFSFAQAGNKVFFHAGRIGNSNFSDLWVSDGTAGGTVDISVGIGGGFGLSPGGFTVFGDKVLFEGLNSQTHYGLWITDGTTAGTHEISVSGASSVGFAPHLRGL